MASEQEIWEAIKVVEDPEIGISIVELGLVYEVRNADGHVQISMTLTTPFCPIGPMLISQLETVVGDLPGIKDVKVDLVWTPPWDPKTMASEEAKDLLGIW
jgi:metal-sulfur cluster biosynthetic enzyme